MPRSQRSGQNLHGLTQEHSKLSVAHLMHLSKHMELDQVNMVPTDRCSWNSDVDSITTMVTTPSILLTDGNISFDMQEKTYQGPITRS